MQRENNSETSPEWCLAVVLCVFSVCLFAYSTILAVKRQQTSSSLLHAPNTTWTKSILNVFFFCFHFCFLCASEVIFSVLDAVKLSVTDVCLLSFHKTTVFFSHIFSCCSMTWVASCLSHFVHILLFIYL